MARSLPRFASAALRRFLELDVVVLSSNVSRKTRLLSFSFKRIVTGMKGKFSAIVEEAPQGGYWAICPEVPGANGQGETVQEAKKSLRAAVRLIFEDRVKDARRGLPQNAIKTSIAV